MPRARRLPPNERFMRSGGPPTGAGDALPDRDEHLVELVLRVRGEGNPAHPRAVEDQLHLVPGGLALPNELQGVEDAGEVGMLLGSGEKDDGCTGHDDVSGLRGA